MTGYTIGKSSTLDVSFRYTPSEAKVTTVTVTAVVVLDGKEYTFTKTIDLDVLNADELVYIGIDGSHHNEYVAGNYKDSMGNFGNLAALLQCAHRAAEHLRRAHRRLLQPQVQGHRPHRALPPRRHGAAQPL